MEWRFFHCLVVVLNRCTSPFLFVFFPPIKMISLGEIERALQAHRGFFILTERTCQIFFSTSNISILSLISYSVLPKKPPKA